MRIESKTEWVAPSGEICRIWEFRGLFCWATALEQGVSESYNLACNEANESSKERALLHRANEKWTLKATHYWCEFDTAQEARDYAKRKNLKVIRIKNLDR